MRIFTATPREMEMAKNEAKSLLEIGVAVCDYGLAKNKDGDLVLVYTDKNDATPKLHGRNMITHLEEF